MKKVCKKTLMEDLTHIGIDPRGTLLCHLSMRAIGPVEGGADAVLDALTEYMKDGLLVIPAHTWNNVNDEHPVFDRLSTPVCVGLLPELFRKRPGVVRSNHPTHSLCAIGADAERFCAGQEQFHTPCAPESCYGDLAKRNAQVLMIGVDFSRNTSIHCIEEVAQVPERISRNPQMLYWTDAMGEMHELPSFRHENAASGFYVKIEPVMKARKVLKTVRFGNAETLMFCEWELFKTVLELLQKDIDLFGNAQPVPKEWYKPSGAEETVRSV